MKDRKIEADDFAASIVAEVGAFIDGIEEECPGCHEVFNPVETDGTCPNCGQQLQFEP